MCVVLLEQSEAIGRMVQTITERLGHTFHRANSLEEVTKESADVLILGHADDAPPTRATLERISTEVRAINPSAVINLLYSEQELIDGFDTGALPDHVYALQVPLAASELRSSLCHGGVPQGESIQSAGDTFNDELSGLQLLVAEDNPTNQFIVRNMLESAGAQVVFADDGRAAVQALLASRYDLVLMDYRMPVMDGIEAAQEIRALEAAGTLQVQTPIIALTANAVEGDDNLFTRAGMDGCLMKPIDLPQLLRVIADKLGVERKQRDNEKKRAFDPDGDATDAGGDNADHLFDVDQLKTLAGEGPGQMDVLLGMLVSEFTTYKREVLDILSDEDAPRSAARLGHKIAGCAFQLGNPSLAQAARALEYAEDDSRDAAVAQLAAMIEDCFAQLNPMTRDAAGVVNATENPC